MALRVWLPLNGSLENKGCSNISIVSGTPSYKTGKIGANALNLNNRITFDCASLANLQTFSICFWGMSEISSTLTANWMDLMGFTDVSTGGNNGTFRWETGYNGNNGIHWHDNTTNAMVNGAHNHITSHGIWRHCCVVFNYEKGKIYSYDDGVLTQTHDHAGGHFNSNGRFYLGETNNIEGRITDVRIYDHALSAAEVKEISQGLVLHYKLDNITNGIQDSSGYGHNGTINGTLTLSNDTPRYSTSSYMSTATTIMHEKPIPNNTDQEWTCSMWVKLDTVGQSNIQLNNFNLGNRIVHSANGHALMYLNSGTNDYYNYGNLAVTANTWTHIAFVFKNSNATKLIYINGVNHTNTGGPNKTSTPSGIPDTVTVGTNLAGYISDYRVYCTALSADDILTLYNTSMRIDKNGSIHTYEFIENNEQNLTREGQLKAKEFIEQSTTQASLVDGTGWKTYELIEM